MKTVPLLCLSWLAIMLCAHVEAQIYDTNNVVVHTLAGSGFSGYVDGQGTQTMFNNPSQVVADTSGNLFVLDYGNLRIRKIDTNGVVSTFCAGGNNFPAYGTNAHLGPASNYRQMIIDRSNTVWTTQTWISTNGLLRIGNDGYVSWIPLPALSFVGSQGVCSDSANNLYISDGNKIYRYRINGVLEIFAGSGNSGSEDGNGIFSSFASPTTLAADSADNIYVWDSGTHLIRRIDQNQNVTTIAGKKNVSSDEDGVGTNASFSTISAMHVDTSGNVIFACGTCIRKMTATTNVLTIAGSFTQNGYANDVSGNLARFNGANGVCISQDVIFVVDRSNQRIRSITTNPSAETVLPANLQLDTYPGLRIVGTVGRTYQIQTSPDLNAWTTKATILLSSSPYLWIDQNPVSGNKFYQAVLLP